MLQRRRRASIRQAKDLERKHLVSKLKKKEGERDKVQSLTACSLAFFFAVAVPTGAKKPEAGAAALAPPLLLLRLSSPSRAPPLHSRSRASEEEA